MRVVDRKTFLALPAGTVYAKGEPWVFESICFKDDRLDNDWFVLDPAWIDAHDTGEAVARLEEMLADGASYPMQDICCRDGVYDEAAIFLVFERADLEKLRGLIDKAISVTPLERV